MKNNYVIKTVIGSKKEEGILKEVYKETNITLANTKRYDTGFDKLMQLNYCEIYLLTWLGEQMDKDCMVDTSSRGRQSFINFILRISQQLDKETIYKDNTIKSALQTLKKLEFLIQPPEPAKRGWCWMNPVYFFREKDEHRIGVIRDVLNSAAGNRYSKLYSKYNLDSEVIELERLEKEKV